MPLGVFQNVKKEILLFFDNITTQFLGMALSGIFFHNLNLPSCGQQAGATLLFYK